MSNAATLDTTTLDTTTDVIATDNRWLDVLREQCDRHNQGHVADELGYSSSVVSQILKGTYTGDTNKVREKVQGLYMGAVVHCHIVGGDIPRNRCIEQQGRPFAATNPLRVQLFHACPTCKHNTKPKADRKQEIPA